MHTSSNTIWSLFEIVSIFPSLTNILQICENVQITDPDENAIIDSHPQINNLFHTVHQPSELDYPSNC